MCPVTCGDKALRKRSVMCVSAGRDEDQPELAVPDHECNKATRPEEVEPCPNLPTCELSSEVPVIVYAENKNSEFYNISPNESESVAPPTTLDGLDSTEADPEILEFDNVLDADSPDENSMYNRKPKWQVSKWSQCLDGRRTRRVFCSAPGDVIACDPDNKPLESEQCFTGKWTTGKPATTEYLL